MPIDYAAMSREHPKLKAALTRAKNSGDPVKVLDAVEKAYDRFDAIGAWPDDWHTWNIALSDADFAFRRSDAYDADLYENDGKTMERFQRVLARAF